MAKTFKKHTAKNEKGRGRERARDHRQDRRQTRRWLASVARAAGGRHGQAAQARG